MAFLKGLARPLQFLNHYILKNNLSECPEYVNNLSQTHWQEREKESVCAIS